MSDPMNCEVCARVGHRRNNAKTPMGWLGVELFISGDEARVAAPGDHEGSLWILAVCSHVCAAKFWQGGGAQSLNGTHPPCVRPTDILKAPVSGANLDHQRSPRDHSGATVIEMKQEMAEHMIRQGVQGFHRGSRDDGGAAFDREDQRIAYSAGWRSARIAHVTRMDVMAESAFRDAVPAPTPHLAPASDALTTSCISLLKAWDIDAAESSAGTQPLRAMNAVLAVRNALGDAAPERAVPDQSRLRGGLVEWLETKARKYGDEMERLQLKLVDERAERQTAQGLRDTYERRLEQVRGLLRRAETGVEVGIAVDATFKLIDDTIGPIPF